MSPSVEPQSESPGISESTLWDALEAIVSALNWRVGLPGHSVRVARYSDMIGRELELSDGALAELRLGALLHDLGQISWPLDFASRSQATAVRTRRLIHEHPEKGAALLAPWPSLACIAKYPLLHQEKYDGSGYPRGLKGGDIPLEVQIVAIADVYEALTHPRGYKGRPALSSTECLLAMKEMASSHWSSTVFAAFTRVLSRLSA